MTEMQKAYDGNVKQMSDQELMAAIRILDMERAALMRKASNDSGTKKSKKKGKAA